MCPSTQLLNITTNANHRAFGVQGRSLQAAQQQLTLPPSLLWGCAVAHCRQQYLIAHAPYSPLRSRTAAVRVSAANSFPYASAVIRFTVTRGMQPSLIRIISRPTAAGLRRPLTAGPLALLLVVLAVVSAMVRTLLHRVSSNVRSCNSCQGFGIQRCKLCEGRGVIGWEGKWSHFEPCPMCLGKRYCRCDSCGGLLHKPLFKHCTTIVAVDTSGNPVVRRRTGSGEQVVAATVQVESEPAIGQPEPFRYVLLQE